MKLLAVFAAFTALACAQDTLLADARALILEAIRSLPRYTCTQTVDRSRFVNANGPVRRASCDSILANRRDGISKPKLTQTDRLRLDVLNSDEGVEVYSWPGAGRMLVERIQDLAGDGDIGTGTFGPFLINIFNAEGVQFIPDGPVEKDGARLLQYRYRVPEKSSHYRVEAGGSTRVVPFDGRFWLDAASLELRRLTVRTGELTTTTGHCEATTSVDFVRMRIGSSEYLLPRESVLETVRRDAAEAKNITRYASCREFTGESIVRFDAVEETPGQAASAASAAVPAGLRITTALLEDIDTSTAAAGDPVRARVLKSAAHPGKGGPALPAGAIIHGRLLQLTHHLTSVPGFSFAIAFESVETGVRSLPLAAIPDRAMVLAESTGGVQRGTHNIVHAWTSGRRTGARGGAFWFSTDAPDMVIRRGTESQWITVAPPK